MEQNSFYTFRERLLPKGEQHDPLTERVIGAAALKDGIRRVVLSS